VKRALLAGLALALTLSAYSCQTPTQVPNGDLEFVQAGKPECFVPVGFGDRAATWSLSSDTHSGSVAEAVEVTNYVSGDAKLIMAENIACSPAVTPGKRYSLSRRRCRPAPIRSASASRSWPTAGW
jgi:hypothetical protein